MNNNIEIIQDLLSEIVPLFSGHLAQIIQFSSDELSDINLAILLFNYTSEDYDLIAEQLHNTIDDYSERYDTTFSVITADCQSIQHHPLHKDIRSGKTIWQRNVDGIHEVVKSELIPKLIPVFNGHLFQIVQFDMSTLSDINLALITTGLPDDDLISYSEKIHKCLSETGITAVILLSDRDGSQDRPLDDDIANGNILWQKEGTK